MNLVSIVNCSDIFTCSLKRAVKLYQNIQEGLSSNCPAQLLLNLFSSKFSQFLIMGTKKKEKSVNPNAITFYIIIIFKGYVKLK